MKSRPQTTLLILSLLLVTAAAVTAQAPRYEVTLLEPLETPEGDLVPVWIAWEINNAGQVVGTATRLFPCKKAPFRYTPGVGMENLDPTGSWESYGKGINERGQVFGYTLKNACNPLAYPVQDRIFLYSDDEGFDFLEKGSSKHIVRNLFFRDMNEAGDIVALVDYPGYAVWQSFLYTQSDGWRNLADRQPRLRSRKGAAAVVRQINNAGDMAVTYSKPGGYRDPFLLLGGEMLMYVGDFGAGMTDAGQINEFGRMIGVSRTASMDDHAYFFSPSGGMVDIQPRRFKESFPCGINSEGVVTGLLRKPGRTYDTLFTWDERRRPRMEILARRADFRALFQESLDYGNAYVFDVNEGLEMVGTVFGRNDSGKAVRYYFYFSPETGVLDLSELFEPFEEGAILVSISDMNDRGDILAEMRTVDGYTLDLVLYKVDE